MGTCLGSQMLLPRMASFVSSITTDEGEAWKENSVPRVREQAMGRVNTFQEWLHPDAGDSC